MLSTRSRSCAGSKSEFSLRSELTAGPSGSGQNRQIHDSTALGASVRHLTYRPCSYPAAVSCDQVQLALRSGKGRSGTENQQSGFEYCLGQFSLVLAQILEQLSRSRPQVINRTVHPCERQIEQNLAPFVADIELPVTSLHLGLPHQLTGDLDRVFACRRVIGKRGSVRIGNTSRSVAKIEIIPWHALCSQMLWPANQTCKVNLASMI